MSPRHDPSYSYGPWYVLSQIVDYALGSTPGCLRLIAVLAAGAVAVWFVSAGSVAGAMSTWVGG